MQTKTRFLAGEVPLNPFRLYRAAEAQQRPSAARALKPGPAPALEDGLLDLVGAEVDGVVAVVAGVARFGPAPRGQQCAL